ncbi:hypothetical protein HELRODRAFT_105460 [Helobdella robusta]|uniref:Gamma-glutamyltransferase n=1 Tax=Helobdella robusta TaxID=6412 RepID=T1EDV0_HELRO|nr:hypothetical protein HELRODRAFT_105460 [Helobdella robusta]ESO12642.1 hypothetical protein HELRODRAFT_105460 [Helobdella robusta]
MFSITREILLKNGSAVDAAISAMFCAALYNFQSCGVGGGFFMIAYDRPKTGGPPEFLTFDAREVAPLKAEKYMYANETLSKYGGLSIAVPGEIKGYHEAWSKFGRLPFYDLVKPSIKLCKEGFKISHQLARAIENEETLVRSSPGLSKLFVNEHGHLRKKGEVIKLEKLAVTLEQIGKNPNSFYEGDLARNIVDELKEVGGIISDMDLTKYSVKMKKPFMAELPKSKLNIYTLPPPSAGPILSFMLRLMDSFNQSYNPSYTPVDAYQILVETLKFGYSLKTHLGDPEFYDVTKVLADILSDEYIESIHKLVTLRETHDYSYYNPHPGFHELRDAGTSHIGVVSPDGGVVAATTTINLVFGSGVIGNRTGILYNDEMNDFSLPVLKPQFGEGNFIEALKRPLSSMAPSILLDHDGNFKYVIGGSGGTKITSAELYVLANRLWSGHKINEAVDKLRLHHQFVPNHILYERGFDQKILDELIDIGHDVKRMRKNATMSVVQVIESTCHLKVNKKCLIAVSDYRKEGKPDGF